MNLIVKAVALTFLATLITGCEINEFSGEASVTVSLGISWTPPVERENGDKLLAYEIGGYEISYRKLGTSDYQSLTIEEPAISDYRLTLPSSGQYEVKVAIFDINGLYSRFSDPAIFSTP